MKIKNTFLLSLMAVLCLVLTPFVNAEEDQSLTLSTAGWSQWGFVGHTSDTLDGQKLNKNQMLGFGGQVLIQKQISEFLSFRVGLGAGAGHNITAKVDFEGGYAPMGTGPYIAEANAAYSFWKEEGRELTFRAGFIPYDYLPDNRNLGLYLLRGPVYPGLLFSGFETKHVLPVANMLGFHARFQHGLLRHDFIIDSETDLFPYFNLSPAYVIQFEQPGAFRLGGGVNFYDLISVEDSLTESLLDDASNYYVDTVVTPDTTIFNRIPLSNRGIKVMANAMFDPKGFMGDPGPFGELDLRIYGEVAILGFKMDKAHKALYGDLTERMPMMVGFNIPAFGFLDNISLEIEYYKSSIYDDLDNFKTTGDNEPSPMPVAPPDSTWDPHEDDIKWSLHASKVFGNHIKFSFQFANDHFRPGVFRGYGDNNPPAQTAIFQTKKDWYFMTKLAYFF